MAVARWQDLCIDAADIGLIGRFWAAALGRELDAREGWDHVLAVRGVTPAETIWVNLVPEPKTVKHRVHLDVGVRSVDDLVALGARVVAPAEETGFRWTVMADPEGGELCAFVRSDHPPDGPPARLEAVVVDTADAASSEAIAGWWAEVLGGRVADDGRGFWWVDDIPGAPFGSLDFVPVPEPKAAKNRIHWDLVSDDLAGLVQRGATVLAEPTDISPWHVCADPDGNEFCVFEPADG